MNIIITGGTGFIGSHLIRGLLNHRKNNIVAIIRSTSDLWRLQDILTKIDLFNISINSYESLIIKYPNINMCIHAATNYGIGDTNTADVFHANLVFPFDLLASLHKIKCKTFVNIDTFYSLSSSSYLGMNNYIQSKKHFKQWGEYFAASNGIRFINARLFHVYGTCDNKDKFVPSIISKLLSNSDVELTEGYHGRDFIYITDAVAAINAILNSSNSKMIQCYDIGTGSIISIRRFVLAAHKILGSSSRLLFGSIPLRDNENSISNIAANTDSLIQVGWAPQVSIDSGIHKIMTHISREGV